MSTKGVIGFQIDGIIKATYNHFSSNPDSLGKNIALFLSSLREEDFTVLKNNVRKLRWVNLDEQATEADIKAYSQFKDLSIGTRRISDWHCLLGKTQGVSGIYYILKNQLNVLIDSTPFLLNSLFCDWGYVINFDKNTLDLYEGRQTQPDPENIFGIEASSNVDQVKYYPCKLVQQAPLRYV